VIVSPRTSRAFVLSAFVLSACHEASAVDAMTDAGAPLDASSDAASAVVSPDKPAPSPSVESSKRAPLELLKLVLTTGVQKKAPVDTIEEATAGERVYAHLTFRNRSGDKRKVHVDFLVNGKLRTPLDLEIEPSWSYRTWGYNTLQAGDKGELVVRVLDETGATIAATRVPIRAKGAAK